MTNIMAPLHSPNFIYLNNIYLIIYDENGEECKEYIRNLCTLNHLT